MTLKNEGTSIFMQKQLTPKQWKICFKKYESYSQSQFWNYYVKFKKTKNITKTQKTMISKSGYYKNKKVTYKPRRDPQLELIITTAFTLIKKIMIENNCKIYWTKQQY